VLGFQYEEASSEGSEGGEDEDLELSEVLRMAFNDFGASRVHPHSSTECDVVLVLTDGFDVKKVAIRELYSNFPVPHPASLCFDPSELSHPPILI